MGILQVQNMSLSFADRTILNSVSFVLGNGVKCALVGGNGEGKSTLLKAICGELETSEGSVTKTRGMKVLYLPQSDIVLGNNTADEELTSFLDPCAEDFNEKRAYVRRIAMGLGLKDWEFDKKCNEFSGGYQMRIALCKILAQNPDVMLLDEPVNYLDIEARLFLRDWIKKTQASVLLVCHDKDFLDYCVSEVLELFAGKLTRYSGNYSSYVSQREAQLKELEKKAEKQRIEREKTEQFIERFRYKATKSAQVQSRIKELEKEEIIQIPPHLKKLSFSFKPSGHSPNDMIVVSSLNKAYKDNVIFKDFNLYVKKGSALAVTGHNGAGKTTLLRIISAEDSDYTGSVKIGPGVKIGYFSQDTSEKLDMNLSVLEQVLPYGSESQMRSVLGSFLFTGDDVYKKTSVLSGGEKSRLALLKVLLDGANLLVLDEPTNHLDINAKDMLLEALKKYDGTVVFVSHDTYFIRGLASQILYLSDKNPVLFDGDYDYFEYKIMEGLNIAQAGTDVKNKESFTSGALSRAEQNRLRNEAQKRERKLESLMLRIEELDAILADISSQMNLEENYSDPEKINPLIKKSELLREEKALIENEWLSLSET